MPVPARRLPSGTIVVEVGRVSTVIQAYQFALDPTPEQEIVVEDLNVSGMTKNRRLARHVAGVGMAELRRQITYKATWSGIRVVVADRWYPSSKTCSACGVVKAKLRLSERTFTCQECGFTLDRDLNAARNLAALADEIAGTSSPSCGATENEPAGNPREVRTRGQRVPTTGRPTAPEASHAEQFALEALNAYKQTS